MGILMLVSGVIAFLFMWILSRNVGWGVRKGLPPGVVEETVKDYAGTAEKENSVGEMLCILKQADPDSIVRNEKGEPVSAYLNVLSGEAIIVENKESV